MNTLKKRSHKRPRKWSLNNAEKKRMTRRLQQLEKELNPTLRKIKLCGRNYGGNI